MSAVRHRLGRYGWRVGILRRTWLLGVEADFAIDGWVWYLGPIALRVWRADR